MRRIALVTISLLFGCHLASAASVTVNIPATAEGYALTVGTVGLVAGDLYFAGDKIGTATFFNYDDDSPTVARLDVLTLEVPGLGMFAILGEKSNPGEPSAAILIDSISQEVVAVGTFSWSLSLGNSTFTFNF